MLYLKIDNKYYEVKYSRKYRGKKSYYIFMDGKLKEITDSENLTKININTNN